MSSFLQQVLNADVSLIITTDGKFAVVAQVNLFDGAVKAKAAFYADLSAVAQGTAQLDMYIDVPLAPLTSLGGCEDLGLTAQRRCFGCLQRRRGSQPWLRADDLLRSEHAGPSGSNEFIIDVFCVPLAHRSPGRYRTWSLSAPVRIHTSGTNAGLWGAADVNVNLPVLEQVGLHISGTGFFNINTTSQDEQVSVPTGYDAATGTFTYPATPLDVAADSVGIDFAGIIQFKPGGVDLMDINGAFFLEFIKQQDGSYQFDAFVAGTWANLLGEL